ncbi:uncharacterized protein B0I36DRAFT_162847 [Microdochium trichocladiopsis]|uniref:Uncharacterized protein n=1 Tax=Microdochium trichocladiopsis TaxID=1682393 RepID=A0A9P8Y0E3_9PEZI|nr:uncharacterized protein B0I36DRAFT_162847 [Microdochium trichocladiopsis]KAH7024546.1 hypothetical protein B0I36DRAFT_162847 [Microdochium trichocladiopsis]
MPDLTSGLQHASSRFQDCLDLQPFGGSETCLAAILSACPCRKHLRSEYKCPPTTLPALLASPRRDVLAPPHSAWFFRCGDPCTTVRPACDGPTMVANPKSAGPRGSPEEQPPSKVAPGDVRFQLSIDGWEAQWGCLPQSVAADSTAFLVSPLLL